MKKRWREQGSTDSATKPIEVGHGSFARQQSLALLRRQVNELHHSSGLTCKKLARKLQCRPYGGKSMNRSPEAGGPPARHRLSSSRCVWQAPPPSRGLHITIHHCPGTDEGMVTTCVPQTIVQLAPSAAPCSTTVVRYSSLRLTAERGLYTLVNTMLGPQKHRLQGDVVVHRHIVLNLEVVSIRTLFPTKTF